MARAAEVGERQASRQGCALAVDSKIFCILNFTDYPETYEIYLDRFRMMQALGPPLTPLTRAEFENGKRRRDLAKMDIE
jgi:hypothetical protein